MSPVEDLYLDPTKLNRPIPPPVDEEFISELTFTSNFTLQKFINAGIWIICAICVCLVAYGILVRPFVEYDTYGEESANIRGYTDGSGKKVDRKALLRKKQEMWDRLPFYKYFFANYRERPTKLQRPNFDYYTASYNRLYQFAYTKKPAYK